MLVIENHKITIYLMAMSIGFGWNSSSLKRKCFLSYEEILPI